MQKKHCCLKKLKFLSQKVLAPTMPIRMQFEQASNLPLRLQHSNSLIYTCSWLCRSRMYLYSLEKQSAASDKPMIDQILNKQQTKTRSKFSTCSVGQNREVVRNKCIKGGRQQGVCSLTLFRALCFKWGEFLYPQTLAKHAHCSVVMAPRICFVEQDPGMLASRRTLANLRPGGETHRIALQLVCTRELAVFNFFAVA